MYKYVRFRFVVHNTAWDNNQNADALLFTYPNNVKYLYKIYTSIIFGINTSCFQNIKNKYSSSKYEIEKLRFPISF